MQTLIYLSLLILFSCAGLIFPEAFRGLKGLIVPLLVLIMLTMGLTLTPSDFKRILKKPHIILYGALLQFTLMPLLGYLVASLLFVDADKAVMVTGFVLVGSAPGGTASNLITYLWGGSLPYSISMTTLSTLLSPFLTPLWTLILAGKYVHVPFLSMALTTLKIVVFPVAGGMIMRMVLGERMNQLERFLPFVAVTSISFIIAVIFALNLERLRTADAVIIGGVLLHNSAGFLLGYLFGRAVGLDHRLAKTLSVEVGMQNSGLSTVLAIKFFSALAALPSAIFSLSQNILGVALSPLMRSSEVRYEGS
jgi:BASS family bile acid:Na+ symporter